MPSNHPPPTTTTIFDWFGFLPKQKTSLLKSFLIKPALWNASSSQHKCIELATTQIAIYRIKFPIVKPSSFSFYNIMVKSRKLLLLSLICSGHAALANYIPRSLSEVSLLLSATSSSSFHHSLKAQPSPAPSHYISHAGNEQSLPLNLTESAIMQVVNHGSSKSSPQHVTLYTDNMTC